MVFPPDRMNPPPIETTEDPLPLDHIFLEHPLEHLPIRKPQLTPAVLLVTVKVTFINPKLPS